MVVSTRDFWLLLLMLLLLVNWMVRIDSCWFFSCPNLCQMWVECGIRLHYESLDVVDWSLEHRLLRYHNGLFIHQVLSIFITVNIGVALIQLMVVYTVSPLLLSLVLDDTKVGHEHGIVLSVLRGEDHIGMFSRVLGF